MLLELVYVAIYQTRVMQWTSHEQQYLLPKSVPSELISLKLKELWGRFFFSNYVRTFSSNRRTWYVSIRLFCIRLSDIEILDYTRNFFFHATLCFVVGKIQNRNWNKHNAELQRTAPDTQYKEAFSRGRLFFFLFFVVSTVSDLVPDISIKGYLHVHVVIQSC